MGAESATPWGAIASAGGALLNFGVGVAQRAKGKKLLRQAGEAPDMSIPNEVLQNQKMAQLAANTGLPQEQYNNAMKNLQRNQLMALRGGQDRRAGLSLLAGSQQMMDDGTLKLDVADANARNQNQRTLIGVNNQVGNWKNKVWQNNVGDKWARKYQYAMSLLGSGNQNATTGVNQLVGAGALYGGMGGFDGGAGGGGGAELTGYSGMRDKIPSIPN